MGTDILRSNSFDTSAVGRENRGRLPIAFVFGIFCTLIFLFSVQDNLDSLQWAIIPLSYNVFLTTFFSLYYIRTIDHLLSPLGVVSVFSVYFIGFAPAAHLIYNFWLYLDWTSHQAEWVTLWAVCQGIGFSILFLLCAKLKNPRQSTAIDFFRKFEVPKNSSKFLLFLLVLTLAARLYQFFSTGGISGIIDNYSDRLDGNDSASAGAGVITLLADMSQTVAATFLILAVRGKKFAKTRVFLIFFLISMAAFAIFFGGLRGSRGNVIQTMLMTIVLYHLLIRRITFKFVGIGLVIVFLYMLVGSWYKFGGIDAVFDSNARDRAYSARQIDDGGVFVALRDFSRADVQSYALQATVEKNYPLAWGRSYLGALTYLIPKSILPGKPATFVKEKTEMRYGKNSFSEDNFTRLVLGQFSEIMLNFGVVASFSIFLFLFFYIYKLNSYFLYGARDSFGGGVKFISLYAPYLMVLPIFLLSTDSNIIVMLTLKYCGPIYILYLYAKFVRRKK